MSTERVTIFTQPGCQPCRMTKQMLNTRNINFEEIDIAESPAALDFVKGLGFKEAPVVLITDSKESVKELLADPARTAQVLRNPKEVIVDSWSNMRPDKITERFPVIMNVPSTVSPVGASGVDGVSL